MIDLLRYSVHLVSSILLKTIAYIILYIPWRNWFLSPSAYILARGLLNAVNANTKHSFFAIYKTCICINVVVSAERRERGYRTTFGITFTHNFETDDFVERIWSRGTFFPGDTIKTITSDSGWPAKLRASFFSLSFFFSFSRRFWLITDIHNRRSYRASKTNVKLCVQPTVKVDESGVQSADLHCASRRHFAERHNFPVFRLCNRSDQFWGRSPKRPSPWASTNHLSRTGFHLGTIYDRLPEASLSLKLYPSILLNPSIITRRETFFVNVFFHQIYPSPIITSLLCYESKS